MKYSLRDIYFYLVSFVMLMVLVFQLFSLVNATLSFFEPTPDLAVPAPKTDNQTLRDQLKAQHPDATQDEIDAMVTSELTRQSQQARQRNMYYKWRRIVEPLIIMIIAYPIYRYHWKRAQQA